MIVGYFLSKKTMIAVQSLYQIALCMIHQNYRRTKLTKTKFVCHFCLLVVLQLTFIDTIDFINQKKTAPNLFSIFQSLVEITKIYILKST